MPAARVRIEITASRLEALATVSPSTTSDTDAGDDTTSESPAGTTDGVTVVRQALAAAGVTAGIRLEVVERIGSRLADPAFTLGPTQIAAAIPPVAGVPGRFELAFDMSLQPGTPRGDGTMDLQDRQYLMPVTEGTVLAAYTKATPGRQGQGVDGSVLEVPEAHDPAPVFGLGVRLEEEGRVVAGRDGVVRWDGGVGLDVVDVVRHNGDVDLESGHLRMEGDIVVTGTVQPGFLVRASGSVEVMGDIDGGTVLAGGDVVVRGGILGTKALVSAGGDVSSRRGQNAIIRAKGRIDLKLDAIDTEMSATQIDINGTVRGGRTEAEISVAAKDAGGAAVGAHLAAGVVNEPPGEVAPGLARLAKAKPIPRKLATANRRSRGASALRAGGAVRARSAVRRAQIRARREAVLPLAHVDVRGTAYPDVKIQLGDKRTTIDRAVGRKRFRLNTRTMEIIAEELP